MTKRFCGFCAPALVLLVCAPTAAKAPEPYEIIVRKNVMIVARDLAPKPSRSNR